jgi:hypothetical protein
MLLWMAALVAVLAGVTRRDEAAWAATVLTLVMAILCHQYVALVHRDDFTGCPPTRENMRLEQLGLEVEKELAGQGERDAVLYPAEWLKDAFFWRGIPAPTCEAIGDSTARIETAEFWHTSFMRLWARSEHPVALWYPGGALGDCSGRLEWRDKPVR